jgi:hypothetical protein
MIDQGRVEVTPKSRYLDDWVRVADIAYPNADRGFRRPSG